MDSQKSDSSPSFRTWLNSPHRVLFAASVVVLALGAAISALGGFENGWRVVGGQTAAGMCVAALLLRLLPSDRTAHSGIYALTMVALLGAAANFMRLGWKWYSVESVNYVQLGILGAAVVVILAALASMWKHVPESSNEKTAFAGRLRRNAAIAGMFAFALGLAVMKSKVTPQSARANDAVVAPSTSPVAPESNVVEKVEASADEIAIESIERPDRPLVSPVYSSNE